MTADISVIIPTYNYAHYLSSALRSVLNQSTPGMSVEIIVIDDGSTDDTPAVAASFGDAIRYIRQKNQGLSATRNTGLSLAAGEFLVFLDADDLLTPGMLASQSKILRTRSSVDIVICLNQLANSATQDSPLYPVGIWPLFKDNHAVHLCQFNIAPPHAFMLRRSMAGCVGGYDTSLKACEDHDYWLRCVVAGFKLAVNPEALVIYRKHADSMSAQTKNQLLHDALLHGRVAKLLRNNPAFLHKHREAAFMAHAAGCLVTAAKLVEIQPERTLQLLDLACLAIKNAARERVMRPKRFSTEGDPCAETDNDVLHYYAIRVLIHLELFNGHNHPGLSKARVIWNQLYPHWEAPVDQHMGIEHALWMRMHVQQSSMDMGSLAQTVSNVVRCA